MKNRNHSEGMFNQQLNVKLVYSQPRRSFILKINPTTNLRPLRFVSDWIAISKVVHWCFLLLICLCSSINSASAHSAGESYFFFQAEENALRGRMEIITNDLNLALPIDDDGNGNVSNEEFEQNRDRIYEFLRPHISFTLGDRKIPLNITGHTFRKASFGTYALINFDIVPKGDVPESIGIKHRSFMETIRPSHKVYIVIEDNARTGLRGNEGTVSHIFEGLQGTYQLSFLGYPKRVLFQRFLNLGFNHILFGFDHIAFLLALLLPTVLLVRNTQWMPQPSFGQVLINVVMVVGTFIIAHSMTLAIATLGWLSFRVNTVEALIALSIVVVAFNNVIGPTRFPVLIGVFFVGLLHGLGFASILAPYGVNESAYVVPLLGFNIGLELGHLAVIFAVLPVFFLVRTWSQYVFVVVRGGSVLLILVAAYWFSERGLRVLGNAIDWITA